jgi:cytochrome P450
VMILIASANRDESQFPNPDRFELERTGQGGLAFGHGVHFCIGMGLARLEAKVSLEGLLSRFQRFERLSREVAWWHTLTVRGLTSLPLRFVPT